MHVLRCALISTAQRVFLFELQLADAWGSAFSGCHCFKAADIHEQYPVPCSCLPHVHTQQQIFLHPN